MKNEKCRVPEGETPVTWECIGRWISNLLGNLLIICLVSFMLIGMSATILWIFGEIKLFPEKEYYDTTKYSVGCNVSVERTYTVVSEKFNYVPTVTENYFLTCSNGTEYEIASSSPFEL